MVYHLNWEFRFTMMPELSVSLIPRAPKTVRPQIGYWKLMIFLSYLHIFTKLNSPEQYWLLEEWQIQSTFFSTDISLWHLDCLPFFTPFSWLSYKDRHLDEHLELVHAFVYSFKLTIYETDTSPKRTPRVGPCLSLLLLIASKRQTSRFQKKRLTEYTQFLWHQCSQLPVRVFLCPKLTTL